MGIYGHKFDAFIESRRPEVVSEGIVDTFKSVIESIKKGIVNLIDKITEWLDKHPDSKVAQGLKSILTKLKNLLTKADKIKSKEDVEEVKEEVDKNKEEAEDLMEKEGYSKYRVVNEYIKEKNIFGLREALGNICYTNRSFSNGDFDKAFELIKSKGIDIMEEFDNSEPLILSNKKLEELGHDDFTLAVFNMKENFCKERIAEAKKIGKYLYGKK